MDLREFWPDDEESVAAYVDIDNAVEAVDAPEQHPMTTARLAAWLRHGWDGEPPRSFLVLDDDGRTVGRATLSTSDFDNLDLAWLRVLVHPDHRRRGLGRAAMERLHEKCREMGRTLVGTDGWDSEATRGFAESLGYALGSRSANRRQPLRELGVDFFETAYAEVAFAAQDYEIVRVEGAAPDDMLEGLVAVTSPINDAPLDDLEMEDEVYSVERLRGFEHAQMSSGKRLYRVVARHRSSGELVGHSVVTVEEDRPQIGEQEDTTVVAAHRGHRLGQLLKADLSRWLLQAEPELQTLDTWNAASNDHMVAVNERLGYRWLRDVLEYQRRL